MPYGQKKYIKWYFLLLLVSACAGGGDNTVPVHIAELENLTVYSGDKKPLLELQLIKEEVFDHHKEHPVGGIAGIAVDRMGKVFIGDHQQLYIHALDSKGAYAGRFGGRGKGPGEFRSMDGTMKINAGFLYAYDPALKRINVFSLDSYEFYRTIKLGPDQWKQIDELNGSFPAEYFFPADGDMLLSFISGEKLDELDSHNNVTVYQQKKYYYNINPDLENSLNAEKILEQKGKRQFLFQGSNFATTFSYPFINRSLLTSGSNYLYSAYTDELLIKVYQPDGSYLRAFYYPVEKKRLTRDEAVSFSRDEILRKIARKMELPATWPALNDMLIDDENRLWISTIVEDDEIYEWWVLKDTGELLARFDWPRNKEIKVVKNGKLYTEETDKNGLARIVRYRIEMSN